MNIFLSLVWGIKTLSPNIKLFKYTPIEVASKQETNSTSIVEVAVKDCFALFQDVGQVVSIT